MVHCGTLCRAIPKRNRRADDIRPYADGATELPPQKFRCAAHHQIPAQERKNRHTTIMGHVPVLCCFLSKGVLCL